MNSFHQVITFPDLVHQSPEFVEVQRLAHRLAESSISVFITGENGTGTWQVASYIHTLSARRHLPIRLFTPARSNATVQARLLFGWFESGTFFPGILHQTLGGSLVIDPIEYLAADVQDRLFRALTSREFSAEGGDERFRIDHRVFTVSKYSPSEITRLGFIRDELMFRLEGIPVELTPLRFRIRDIIPLIKVFSERIATLQKIQAKNPDRQAAEALISYSWPGNTEELYQVTERALMMSTRNDIRLADLYSPVTGQNISKPTATMDIFSMDNDRMITLEEAKDFLFRKAMRICNNRVEEAGRLLGIGRATAFRMHARLGNYQSDD